MRLTLIASLRREPAHRSLSRSLEPALGIQLDTPYRFGKDLTAYRKAAEAHDAARTLRVKTLYPEQYRLDRQGKALVSKSQNVPQAGIWPCSGTNAGRLPGVPQGIDRHADHTDRAPPAAAKARNLLKANPEFEVEKMGVTAEKAEGLFTALSSVRTAIESQEKTEGTLSVAVETIRAALKKRLRGLCATSWLNSWPTTMSVGPRPDTSPPPAAAETRQIKAKAEARSRQNRGKPRHGHEGTPHDRLPPRKLAPQR